MTKHYHITREQALEIAKRLSVVSDEGFIDSDYLEEIINAALDKVLGEPVAYEYFDENADYHLTNEEPPEYVTATNLTPLYAPKGLTLG